MAEPAGAEHGVHEIRDGLIDAIPDAVILAATVALTGFHHSIGFLDRPERHVSPDRSAAWLRGLRSLGANNQWLIASSDPGFVGLAGQAVVTLGPRDGSPAREGGIVEAALRCRVDCSP